MTTPDVTRRLLEQATRELRRLRAENDELRARRPDPIAVIGLACRFPGGADDPDALWRLLLDARDVVREIPGDRWPADPQLAGLRGARWAGLLDAPLADFDAAYFGIAPREADSLDPQQRLLLELACESLADAGLALDRLPARDVGVYVGISDLDYQDRVDAAPLDAYSATGNLHSTAAGRISYCLDLHGPSVAVDTACSSALVAVHLALQSLQRRDCSLALAGGVNLILSPRMMEKVARTQALAADGRCKAFDARADGFVRAEGCGVLLLKRLADAQRDGDTIRAVLRGSAVGHDGRSTGLTAPSPTAQARVMRAALADAGLAARDIGCIEAHGTGTALGDPIEAEALLDVYGAPRPDAAPCALGSIKTNLGHSEAASGLAALLKIILALEHEQIPPHLHLTALNPRIRLDASALTIPTRLLAWPRGQVPRRGAVNAFGISGTNAHVIVEEAPRPTATTATATTTDAPDPSPRSIATATTTDAPAPSPRSTATDAPDPSPRSAVTATTTDALAPSPRSAPTATAAEPPGPPVLLPISARSPAALRELLARHRARLTANPPPLPDLAHAIATQAPQEPHRRALVGRTAADLIAAIDADLPLAPPVRARPRVVFVVPGHGAPRPGLANRLAADSPAFREALAACAAAIHRHAGWDLHAALATDLLAPDRIPPALWALAVALAAQWRAWGVEPDAILGHGPGEAAAAHLAGALDLDQAARVICAISHRPAADLSRGPADSPADLSRGPADSLTDLSPGPARIPLHSTRTGQPLAGPELDPSYWTHHSGPPAHLDPLIRALAGDAVFIELGPHPVLVPTIAATLAALGADDHALASIAHDDEPLALRAALGALFERGHPITWERPDSARPRLPLPHHPWQRERHWLDPLPLHALPRGLPGLRRLLADDPDLHVWDTTLTPDDPIVADHHQGDRAVLPASIHDDLFRRALAELGAPWTLHDLRIERPLELLDGPTAIQLTLRTTGIRGAATLHSRRADHDTWLRHTTARLDRVLPPAPADTVALTTDPAPAVAALTDTPAPAAPADTVALTTDPAPAVAALTDTPAPAAPTLTVTPAPAVTAPTATPATSADAALAPHDLAATPPPDLEPSEAGPDLLHTIAWIPAPPATALTPAEIRLTAADPTITTTLARHLTAHGAAATSHSLADAAAYRSPPAVLVVLLADSTPADPARAAADTLTDLVALVRALLRRGDRDPPRLVLVTRGAEPAGDVPGDRIDHAATWGLGRTVMHEHPELRCTLIDLDPAGPDPDETEALARELLTLGPEDQLALRRPRPAPSDTSTAPAPSDTLSAPAPSDTPTRPDPSDTLTEPAPSDTLAPPPSTTHRLVARLHPAPLAPTLTPAGPRPFALVQQQPGLLDGLTLRACPRPPPGPGEVELAVEAAGLNFLDVLLALDVLPDDTHPTPPLGSECVGRVTALGPGVTILKPGDRVLALAPRSFATHVLAPAVLCVALPAGLTAHAAAALPIAGLTALYALDHVARVRPGERVLIHAAAGGVGLLALQLALARGCEVFATAGTPAKRRLLRERGAHHVGSSRDLSFVDLVRRATAGEGVDVLINTLAGDLLAASLELLRPGGRFVELGKRDYADDRRLGLRPFLRRISWTLVDLRGLIRDAPDRVRDLLDELLALRAAGVLTPPPHRVLPISDARDAFVAMARGDHTGKLVLDLTAAATTPIAPPLRPSLPPDGITLISAPTTTALTLARWLVDRGARRLVLLDPHPLDPTTHEALAALHTNPTDLSTTATPHPTDLSATTTTPHPTDLSATTTTPHPTDLSATTPHPTGLSAARRSSPIPALTPRPIPIQHLHADPTDPAALAAALASLDAPLVGVVHALSLPDPAPILTTPPDRLATLTAAINLHRATAHLPLDFFLLCGSASAVLGASGHAAASAASAALAALARHRRARDLPAQAIDWGPADDLATDALAGHGLEPLSSGTAAVLLDRALARGAPRVLAARLHLRRWRETHPALARAPLLADLSEQTAAASTTRARLGALARPERVLALHDLLRAHLARVLRRPPAGLGLDDPLQQTGLDSLMAMELRNRLEADLGLGLAVTLIWRHPTLRALADHLADQLAPPSPPPAPPPADPPDDDSGDAIARFLAAFTAIAREPGNDP